MIIKELSKPVQIFLLPNLFFKYIRSIFVSDGCQTGYQLILNHF